MCTPEALVVVAPFPDDVTVELRPGTLRISARLRSSGLREYLVHEWEYGGYEREVGIPKGYGGGVEASLTKRSTRRSGLEGTVGRHDLSAAELT
jgi:hypothetical protein